MTVAEQNFAVNSDVFNDNIQNDWAIMTKTELFSIENRLPNDDLGMKYRKTSSCSSEYSKVSATHLTFKENADQSNSANSENKEPLLRRVEDYATSFDPTEYINEFYATAIADGEPSPLNFILESLNIIRAKLQMELPLSLTERTLVEFGCGPTIHTVMSLSDLYDAIYLCDANPACRSELLKFKNEEPDRVDWTPMFETVAKFESGFSLVSTCRDAISISPDLIEHRLRKSIHGILECDILADNFKIVKDLPCETVDCLVSSLTIEAVSTTVQQYNKALRQLANLLSPDGFLIIIGIFDTSNYIINSLNESWPMLSYDEMDLRCALRYAGLNVKYWFRQCAKTDKTLLLDFNAYVNFGDNALESEKPFEDMFVLVAQKR